MKTKTGQGKRVYGTAITSPSSMWAKVVKKAGLDFVFIDTEHFPLNRETVSNMCHLYAGMGITPMVRIPSADPDFACMVLDGGAEIVLAPYVEDAGQVRALVGAVKYRPLKGKKLEKILNGDEILSGELKDYIEARCSNNMLFINIESKPAVENLKDILAVRGLDGVIIGPHDLSCSYGIPEQYKSEIFDSVVKMIINECKSRKLAVGIHLPEDPEHQIKWAGEGVDIILHSSDISLFSKMLNKEINYIRDHFNDDISNGNDDFVI